MVYLQTIPSFRGSPIPPQTATDLGPGGPHITSNLRVTTLDMLSVAIAVALLLLKWLICFYVDHFICYIGNGSSA